MKIYPFVFVLCLIGCKNAIKNEVATTYLASNSLPEKTIGNTNTTISSKEDLIGFWKGDLYKSEHNKRAVYLDEEMGRSRLPKYRRGNTPQLLLLIKEINNEALIGDVFSRGEIKHVKGTLIQHENSYEINITEPKAEYALKFKFVIDLGTKSMHGNWERVSEKSNDKTNETVLEKKIFQYNSEAALAYRFINWDKYGKIKGLYEYQDSLGKTVKEKYEYEGNLTTTDTIFSLNPSKTVFNKELVENLSRGDLYILKNLIYARHGLVFKNEKLSTYFNSHSWYLPISNDVANDLTEVEKKNIDLLQRYEKNAKDYYQVFGR